MRIIKRHVVIINKFVTNFLCNCSYRDVTLRDISFGINLWLEDLLFDTKKDSLSRIRGKLNHTIITEDELEHIQKQYHENNSKTKRSYMRIVRLALKDLLSKGFFIFHSNQYSNKKDKKLWNYFDKNEVVLRYNKEQAVMDHFQVPTILRENNFSFI